MRSISRNTTVHVVPQTTERTMITQRASIAVEDIYTWVMVACGSCCLGGVAVAILFANLGP